MMETDPQATRLRAKPCALCGTRREWLITVSARNPLGLPKDAVICVKCFWLHQPDAAEKI
jgi:hypothetical protein